jgi:hypothetical protein
MSFSFDGYQEYQKNTKENQGYVVDPVTNDVLTTPLGFKDRVLVGYGDTVEEKAAIFYSLYPDGDFTTINGKLAFRKTSEDSYSVVDKPFLQSLNDPKEFMTDIVEAISESPEIVVSTAIALGTKNPSSIAKTLALFGLSGSGTEITNQAIQEVFGIQKETAMEAYVQRPLVTGFIEAGGGAVGHLVQRLTNAFKGGGLAKVSPEARIGQQSAKDIGIYDDLTVGQLVTSPFIRKLQGQVEGTTGSISDAVSAQRRQINAYMKNINPTNYDDLVNKVTKIEQKAMGDAIKLMQRGEFVSTQKAGNEILKAISQYENASQVKVGSAYAAAKSILKGDDILYDISNLKSQAAKLKQGVQAVNEKGKDINVKPLETELLKVVNEILSIPDANYNFQILNAFRERIYPLTIAREGDYSKYTQTQAKSLRSAVVNTLEDVQSTDKKFLKAWQNANKLARKRFNTLDELMFFNSIGKDTPEIIAQRLFQLDSPTLINKAKKAFYYKTSKPYLGSGGEAGIKTRADWARVQDAFIAEFLDNSNNLGYIKNTSQQSIKAILEGKSKNFIKAVNNIYKIQKNNLTKISDAKFAQPFIDQVLSNPQAGQLVQNAVKQFDQTTMTKFRAGLIDNIFANSTSTAQTGASAGINVVDPARYSKVLSNYERKGLLDILDPSEIKMLKNIENVLPFVNSAADVGASLESAAIVAQAKEFKGSAIKSLLINIGIGRILTSKKGKDFIVGHKNMDISQATNAAFAILANEAAKITNLKED